MVEERIALKVVGFTRGDEEGAYGWFLAASSGASDPSPSADGPIATFIAAGDGLATDGDKPAECSSHGPIPRSRAETWTPTSAGRAAGGSGTSRCRSSTTRSAASLGSRHSTCRSSAGDGPPGGGGASAARRTGPCGSRNAGNLAIPTPEGGLSVPLRVAGACAACNGCHAEWQAAHPTAQTEGKMGSPPCPTGAALPTRGRKKFHGLSILRDGDDEVVSCLRIHRQQIAGALRCGILCVFRSDQWLRRKNLLEGCEPISRARFRPFVAIRTL
jgi:hypothetical protein